MAIDDVKREINKALNNMKGVEIAGRYTEAQVTNLKKQESDLRLEVQLLEKTKKDMLAEIDKTNAAAGKMAKETIDKADSQYEAAVESKAKADAERNIARAETEKVLSLKAFLEKLKADIAAKVKRLKEVLKEFE